MSAPETSTSVATRSNQGTVAPKEALKLRLDLNLEVEIAIQAKVNGDITLSLLKCLRRHGEIESECYCRVQAVQVMTPPKSSRFDFLPSFASIAY
ncbi:uncharacterized protein ARMOST_19648 [Armillaria ostoyae]|uniref:Uncharacterized protein n=2 Tax=Physalacriaceae TaxID=862241 RepID=A0A284S542_ARMOS|nr:uncharacterized protein ARMOST_19648 [Armillaria ostoyae]